MCTDCCDGTDEVKGCKNTCKEAGSAARLDLISQAKEFTAGAKTRQKYISQSQASKTQWKSELTKVQKEISVQQGITDKAKGLPLCKLLCYIKGVSGKGRSKRAVIREPSMIDCISECQCTDADFAYLPLLTHACNHD